MTPLAAASSLAGFALAGFKPGIVTLEVNGVYYEGFEQVEVTRAVRKMAGEFTLKVSERTGSGSALGGWRIRPGDKCRVLYAGLPVVTGHVDAYNPRYDDKQHEVTIQGRSKTGDLCDCSAEADVEDGEMRDVSIDQMARKVAKPYGIGVKVEADTSHRHDVSRVRPGETVHEWLERYARPGAVALTDTEDGDLRLLHVEDGAAVTRLVEGVNILEASATLRADNRYSDYEVKGQDHGNDQRFGRPVAEVKSKVQDTAVKRYRPFRMLNETKTSRADARRRAAWEAAARAGESVRVEIKVLDWVYMPGKLWRPGDRVHVSSPMLAVDRVLAIETVKFHQGGETHTKLSLVPPEALNPKAGKGGGKSGGSDSVWTSVKPDAEPSVSSPLPGIVVVD